MNTSTSPHRVEAARAPLVFAAALFSSLTAGSALTLADDAHLPGSSFAISGNAHGGHLRADGHAPIGVMGEHMHKKGGWMLSYRYMHMNMEGNRIGTRSVTPEQIVTTVPNRFAVPSPAPGAVPGATVLPPLLRIVPTKMTMDMHMFGAMYAPTDNLTLMFMLPYIRKSMDHVTFAPGIGDARVGGFTTKSEGIGDAKISGLIRLYDDQVNHVHLNMGISAPTGSTKESDDIFDPFGRTPRVRLPYPMQIGSGTWDLLPGITYTGRAGDVTWGAQYSAEIRLEDENDEGYALGDKHTVTGWLAYQFAPWISTSFRASYTTQDEIDGFDTLIAGPVQTAYPEFSGGEKVELFGGINMIGQSGWLRGHRFALEAGAPVHQDLNGPQMETDWTLTVGWQKAF